MGPLTNEEAATLRAIEKYLTSPAEVCIPAPGRTAMHGVEYTRDERLHKDMTVSLYHGRTDVKKMSYRLLYRGTIKLVRVDLGDKSMHRNPDGSVLLPGTPHIHLYDEEQEDHVAHPLPSEFASTDDLLQTLKDFLSYSHIINVDEIGLTPEGVLFL